MAEVPAGQQTGESGAQKQQYVEGAAAEAAKVAATNGANYGMPPVTPNPLAWMKSLSPIGASYLASLPSSPQNASSAAAATVAAMIAQGVPEDLAGQMTQFITGQITGTATPNHIPATADEATEAMYTAPFFTARFPGIGQLGITPATWIQQEQGYYQTASAAGMAGFVSQGDAAQLIQGHVSQNELAERVTDAYNASKGADPNTLAALSQAGINSADVAKMFLDPDNQVNALTQKVTTAQVAGVAKDQGFQGLTAAQAAQVASGVQASSGGAVTPMTLTQIQQNSGIQNAEMNESLTKAHAVGQQANDINTLSSATVLGAALGVSVGGLTTEQEEKSVMGAIQTKAAASSGGGGFGATKRGAAVGYGGENGAEGDQMGGQA